MDTLSDRFFTVPLRLTPDNFTNNVWGGDWIARWKGAPKAGSTVGESWEFSGHSSRPSHLVFTDGGSVSCVEALADHGPRLLGPALHERFGAKAPFLVKIIDAEDDLSVQVHPTHETARPGEHGKTESWIVLDRDIGAGNGRIYLGFSGQHVDGFSAADFFENAFFSAIEQANSYGPSTESSVRERSARLVLPFLNDIAVQPGDVFHVPPGTPHCIGRHVRLFEIQETSDVTYRLWDWNRPDPSSPALKRFRPLHLSEARTALQFSPAVADTFRCEPAAVQLLDHGNIESQCVIREKNGLYAVDQINWKTVGGTYHPPLAFSIMTVIKGTVDVLVKGWPWGRVQQGASVFMPACSVPTAWKSVSGEATVFRSFVPQT